MLPIKDYMQSKYFVQSILALIHLFQPEKNKIYHGWVAWLTIIFEIYEQNS